MKLIFKDKCDVCGKYKTDCRNHDDKMIVCEECRNKHHGKYELDDPVQLSIYDVMEVKNEK